MSIAKASEPTELDPVVIGYEETIDKIRKGGSSLVEAFIGRMRPMQVKKKVEKWRKGQPNLTPESVKKYLAVEEP